MPLAERPQEEQTLSLYYYKRYYPVKIGQIFNNRYKVLTKLGYGSTSTVWLARDQKTQQYKALKVCVRSNNALDKSSFNNEAAILQHLATCPQEHQGAEVARLASDIFDIDGHACFVMMPHAGTLQDFQDAVIDGQIPRELLLPVTVRVILCLNWLQRECGVAHTEITPPNITIAAADDSTFRMIEQEEVDYPSQSFTDHHHPYPHPIYPSRGRMTKLNNLTSDVFLSDFGSAKILGGLETTSGWWMPDTYRAPEILMSVSWSHEFNIWSCRNVFDPIDKANKQYVLPLAISQYIGFMGLPPLSMIQQSEDPIIKSYFDEKGNWIVPDAPIPSTSLEDFVTVIPLGEERMQFLGFMKRIFVWDPQVRANSFDLFDEEWIQSAFRPGGLFTSQ